LESAKKLQAHADNALGFLKSVQPLDDIIPDVFPSENMTNQPAARPKAEMWKYSQSLTERVVHDVEDAMMNYIGEDPPTDASAHTTTRDRRRSTSDQDEPTTPETYGAFVQISLKSDTLKKTTGGWLVEV
jgi:hypothetical protein